jgi:hypothetical protein
MSFGPYARFGTITKEVRDVKLTYEPSEMVGTRRRGINGAKHQGSVVNIDEPRRAAERDVTWFRGAR